jgi:hypothetical protein
LPQSPRPKKLPNPDRYTISGDSGQSARGLSDGPLVALRAVFSTRSSGDSYVLARRSSLGSTHFLASALAAALAAAHIEEATSIPFLLDGFMFAKCGLGVFQLQRPPHPPSQNFSSLDGALPHICGTCWQGKMKPGRLLIRRATRCALPQAPVLHRSPNFWL